MSIERGQAIPPGFWNLPPVRDTLDRQDVGAMLALVVEHCGMSQHALAGLLDMAQPQIWNYIHGIHKPTMNTIAKIADRLVLPPHARQRLGLARTVDAAGPRVRLSQILDLAEHIGRSNNASCLDAWREAAKAEHSDDAWTRLAQVISIRPPAQLRGSERMTIRTRGLFYIAAKLPARLLIEALASHIDHIGLLLDAVPCPDVRRELTALSGEASYLAACCQIDLGNSDAALSGLEVTGEAARQADDHALTAITLDGHSHFRAFTGDHQEALTLVTEGLEAATMADSPGTLAYMQLRAAEEHVALGHTTEAIRAWEMAEASYAKTDLLTDRDWTRLWLTPNCFGSVRAVIYASTGRATEATSIAKQIAARLDGTLGKSDAVSLVNAALALAMGGKSANAASIGRRALRAVRAAEATGCVPRAQVIAGMLRDHAKLTASSRGFLADLEATQRHLDSLRPAHAYR